MAIRDTLLRLGRSERARNAVASAAFSQDVVDRFIPGASQAEALAAGNDLIGKGLSVCLHVLGEDTVDRERATQVTSSYLDLLSALGQEKLGRDAEVSLKLSAVGQFLGVTGEQFAYENAREVCRAARDAGTAVTLDMESHTATDSTLRVLARLREDFPETGVAVQARLRRSEADCRALATDGSRVRLCKGAYREPEAVAFTDRHNVDLSYVRCLRALMQGDGYPMVATHDPRMISIAGELAEQSGRGADDYEFQMFYGVRPVEQRRLADTGQAIRVYVPFGPDWYGYFMRRLAERPGNLTSLLRSMIGRR